MDAAVAAPGGWQHQRDTGAVVDHDDEVRRRLLAQDPRQRIAEPRRVAAHWHDRSDSHGVTPYGGGSDPVATTKG